MPASSQTRNTAKGKAKAKVKATAKAPTRQTYSADGGSALTTRFLSATTKGFGVLTAFLGISSFSGCLYFLWQWQEWAHKNQERDQPVQTIVHSQVRPYLNDRYIPRTELSDTLKAAVFSMHEDVKDYFISITGNHEVGKSQLVRHVLNGHSGVLEVFMKNSATPEMAISTVLGVADEAVARAFVEAERRLGHKPVIVLDIHERVTDPKIIDEISNFVKSFGYEQQLAKVLVVCSTAATAAGITGDGRKINFFVPHFTREDLDSADARRVFKIWHGKPVHDSDVDRIFDLVGGSIGNIKDILVFGKQDGMDGSLDKALARMEGQLLYDIQKYQAIDMVGGFSDAKIRVASYLAREVARFPFEQCLPLSRFSLPPEDFGKAARDRHAHPIYYHPTAMGYCARSPFVHRQLGSVEFHSTSLRNWG